MNQLLLFKALSWRFFALPLLRTCRCFSGLFLFSRVSWLADWRCNCIYNNSFDQFQFISSEDILRPIGEECFSLIGTGTVVWAYRIGNWAVLDGATEFIFCFSEPFFHGVCLFLLYSRLRWYSLRVSSCVRSLEKSELTQVRFFCISFLCLGHLYYLLLFITTSQVVTFSYIF